MTVQGLTRRWHVALRGHGCFAVIAAQGNIRAGAGGRDSRLLPDGFQQALDDADLILLQFPGDGALASENVIWAKARSHRQSLFQARPEKRSTREQDKGEGNCATMKPWRRR